MSRRMKKSNPTALTISIALFVLISAALPGIAHDEQRYTAQRRPRVTVMEFHDTNTAADHSEYGESVSAMLVTYLKTKSQFVVVERQDIRGVLDEWNMIEEGRTKQDLTSKQIELLERIDVIIQGSVTILGNRIEVDGKLLSREDGRIITAAERSGPIDCLRQIVDRLGVALETSFLTPYYGRVQLTLYEPDNVHFLLTPILTPQALDEEKPPGELGATIIPGEDKDIIRNWIAGPATHTIENLLAGWYTLRLSRGGYEDVKISNSVLRAVEASKGFEVRYHKDSRMLPLDQAPDGERLRQLLVRVDSLATNEIDLSSRGIEMKKLQGALDFAVLDENKDPLPEARIMMRSVALAINPGYRDALRKEIAKLERDQTGDEAIRTSTTTGNEVSKEDSSKGGAPKVGTSEEGKTDETNGFERALYKALDLVDKTLEKNVDQKQSKSKESACEYFIEERPPTFDHGSRIVHFGETLRPQDFKGGELFFENYQGESVPVGMYEVVAWAPRQVIRKITVMISEDRDVAKIRNIDLARQRRDVLIIGKSKNIISFKGEETGLEQVYGMDLESGHRMVSLPVDRFDVQLDGTDSGAWMRELDLRLANEEPPSLDDVFMENGLLENVEQTPADPLIEVRVKSTIWVGGRFQNFRPFPHTFYNPRIGELLDQILEETSVYDWTSLEADDDKLTILASRLQDIDLLILDEDDMSRMRVFPELATVIRSWVESGHSLMAFVTREGDYENVLGKPLRMRRRSSSADRVRLNFEGGDPTYDYDVEIGSRRELPRLKTKNFKSSSEWRIVAYTKKEKRPRIVESGSPVEGGYIMVWFETARVGARWQAFVDEASGLGRILRPVARFFTGERSAKSWEHLSYTPESDAGEDPESTAATYPAASGTSSAENGPKAEKKRRQIEIDDQIKIGEARWKARLANDEIALAKTQLMSRALLWAEYLMYRRVGDPDRLDQLRDRIR